MNLVPEMVIIGWILIGLYILFVLVLLAKDEYYDKREQKRRLDLRAQIRWPVTIQTNAGVMEAEIANISAGGALLCCPNKLPLSEIMRLTIRPPVRAPLEITGEVIRVDDVHCTTDERSLEGVAVRFIIISEKDREFIAFSVFDHLQKENSSS